MTASSIVSVEAALFAVPLAEVLVDAKHGDHTHFDLITVTVRLADGTEGIGYTYTGGRGGRAILSVLRDEIAPLVTGADGRDIASRHAQVHWHLHYVGRGGIVGFALSAFDIALWDLKGRAEGRPLWRMAGGAGRSARAYAGGIDLAWPEDRLVAGVEAAIARGACGYKMKVGRPDPAEDLRRAAAVRAALGPERDFMVDANYSLTVDQAIAAARGFAEHGILWFEEPIDPDDLEGYARIAEATGVPLAMGENLHILPEFARALRVARLSHLQPDASNCGGITGWLAAAALARDAGIPVSSHGMQELHVSLVAGQPNPGWVELHAFPIEDYTIGGLAVRDGRAQAPDRPGTGVQFDWPLLKPHLVG